MSTLSFRPMAQSDLALVAEWLRQEHVQRWWKDPTAPDNVEETYLPRIQGAEPAEMLVIVWDGRDIGMVQRYRMDDHPDWERSLVPSGLGFGNPAGIDYVIGEPELIGHGIGSVVIEAFSAAVFERYPDVESIVVTPQAANRASCRVLEKAGYQLDWTGMIVSADPSDGGPAALYILRRPGFR